MWHTTLENNAFKQFMIASFHVFPSQHLETFHNFLLYDKNLNTLPWTDED